MRHEEAGAFAAGAQAQLTGRLGVCMGTVGPGAIHLLNGLYDAKKSHAPVLAICGQVPRAEIGSDFFQEVDNDALFADVAVFRATVTTAEQLPGLLEQAVQRRARRAGRRGADPARRRRRPRRAQGHRGRRGSSTGRAAGARRADEAVRAAAAAIDAAGAVTLLVGQGARHAREPRCSSSPSACPRRWCSRSRPRRASRTTTPSRSASPG